MLDALQKYRAHATFFVVGNRVDGSAGIVGRAVKEGNEIGNHTWGHTHLPQLTGPQIDSQILDTQAAVTRAAPGYAPTHLRPPYGEINPAVTQHLHGLKPAFWTVDTHDWLDRDEATIYSRIMASATPGAIILLHDIHPASVAAAVQAVHSLRAAGWELVTLSQL